MSDLTTLFKAYVKTIKLHNKNIPVNESKKLQKDAVMCKARDLKNQITQLRNFLVEKRASYMHYACHLKKGSKMSSSDRELIDKEVNAIIDICTKCIFELKMENEVLQAANQQKLHTNLIIELLMSYLKAVYNIFSDQKNYRVNRDLETYRFLKLNATSKLQPKEGTEEFIDIKKDDDVKESEFGLKRRKTHSTKNDSQPIEDIDEGIGSETLDSKDLMQLEIENKQLLNVYKGLSEEIQMIERNALEVAKLQSIFAENVSKQKYEIENTYKTVVATTENVREANQQIQEATQRNAGLRVYLLFFFIVMSFSLLFLDWYND